MYNKILVPVDLSEEGFADHAVAEATKVCAAGGTLVLLTVVAGYQMPVVGSFFPDGAFDKAFHAIERQLKDFADAHLNDANLTLELVVKEGGRAETILQQAQSHQADLIVMASHKQTGVKSGILGSVANKVVNLSPIPVMVVKS
jgi:nucleotide-binding universal stress UspA family protein